MNFSLNFVTNIKIDITIVIYSDYNKVQEIKVPAVQDELSIVNVNRVIRISDDAVIKVFTIDKKNNISQLFTSLSPLIVEGGQLIHLYKTAVSYKTKYTDLSTYLSEVFINRKCYITSNNEIMTLFVSKVNTKALIKESIIDINDNYIYYPYTNQVFYRVRGLNFPDTSIAFRENNNIDTITAPFDCIIRKDSTEDSIIFYPHYEGLKDIYMPFSGKLIGYYVDGDVTTLEFINSFFMPHDVLERDLASVHNGNYTYSGVGVGMGNRNNPQVILPQPNTKMKFRLVLDNNIRLEQIINKEYYYNDEILIKRSNSSVKLFIDRRYFLLDKYIEGCSTYTIRGDRVGIIQ